MPRLGCGESSAVVRFTCGQTFCHLTDASLIEWNRRIDDLSTARIEIPRQGGSSDNEGCCKCVGDIFPHCHQLDIYREAGNGQELVWTGIIQRITHGYNGTIVEAEDPMSIMKVRVNELGGIFGPGHITDIAEDLLTLGFAEKGGECFFPFITKLTDPSSFAGFQAQFPAFEETVFDSIQSLADLGLDWTVVSGRIILMSEGQVFGVNGIGTLTDQHFIGGDIEVIREGDFVGNRFFVRYKNDNGDGNDCATNPDTGPDEPCPSISEDTDSVNGCYGVVERLRSDTVAFGYTSAKMTADLYLKAGSGSPTILDIPPGTTLSPDTPFGINEMIPGQNVRVALTGLCLPVNELLKLAEVSYRMTPEREEIGITLSPLNNISNNI